MRTTCSSSLVAGIWAIALLVGLVYGYVPASATDDMSEAIAGGLNVTDQSKLHVQWYENGSYWETVSYQLIGSGSSGISKGALVHFSESEANNDTAPTTTPWIAMVSCDQNATNMSMEIDIFTLARDKGAVAALLYSLNSSACIINPEYADPDTFDQVFDIFSTQSKTSAHLIEYQFGQSGANETLYGWYNSQRLNDSFDIINSSIGSNTPMAPGYLFATLQAYNATDNTTTSGTNSNNDKSDSGNKNTTLAMIILYVITGIVSALFCAVIISGAVRAVRHPERYGPRAMMHRGAMHANYGPQSRAKGLTRAILDTFPLVQFRRPEEGRPPKDVEDGDSHMMQMGDAPSSVNDARAVPTMDAASPEHLHQEATVNASDVSRRRSGSLTEDLSQQCDTAFAHGDSSEEIRESGPSGTSVAPQPAGADVSPDAMGTDTCPICIVDFEEGDDLRVLPCEGRHQFHQKCVDPWLLQLSSSCPICRHDFLALENMLARGPDDEGAEEEEYSATSRPEPPSHTSHSRFSRYLRFARRRRHDQREHGSAPTPPLPPSTLTAM
ncbi:hypothetical protein BD626DRAFT_475878 [Schizophyllum amplum]|uniref:RING-type domain-containing protein n=1 Tax=Schizophyllum amplum TaxID=97359 RepID=A0A550CYU7_9AGAR|nr:hypothetical protein BD626DRAFT_475878 [Auriculariopsis ampla]